ncbi:MAG TPA: lipopolysaccharide heptosyltransferase II [Candidatus Omnitrophota bacterium]|nr:lipopolysaccharide heptosyltransferase II [Candidatus Omnitrophota bacterium]
MKIYQNILVVRTDRIGDVILTTPALQALRHAFPTSRITLLVSPQTFLLVNKNPYVNEVLIDDRKKTHKGVFGFWRLVKEIRRKRFDLAIIYHTKRRTNLLCFWADIPERIGYKNNKFGFLLTQPVLDERYLGKKHEAEYCLELLSHVGVHAQDKKLHVCIQEEAEQWLGQLFKYQGIKEDDCLIAVHLGASDPSKEWPVEYFAEVINAVLKKYPCRVVLVGTDEVKALCHKVLKLVPISVLDLSGMTSLSQLASFLRSCRLLISNDSGPVHLAAGLGTPVVSIFTRNQPGINPERWRPLEPRSQVVSVPQDTAPSFKKAGIATAEYLHNLKPDAVLEAVDAVFKLC